MKTEKVILAAGCFWGVQGVFQHVKGVTNAVSGYAGGEKQRHASGLDQDVHTLMRASAVQDTHQRGSAEVRNDDARQGAEHRE
jgi:peptide methionine sulfoxide reductase MsrA